MQVDTWIDNWAGRRNVQLDTDIVPNTPHVLTLIPAGRFPQLHSRCNDHDDNNNAPLEPYWVNATAVSGITLRASSVAVAVTSRQKNTTPTDQTCEVPRKLSTCLFLLVYVSVHHPIQQRTQTVVYACACVCVCIGARAKGPSTYTLGSTLWRRMQPGRTIAPWWVSHLPRATHCTACASLC